MHQHSHCHQHGAARCPESCASSSTVLTIRSFSGISGDMMLCGLIKTLGIEEKELNEILKGILPDLEGSVEIARREVNGIGGFHAEVNLPHAHEHRTLKDIEEIISKSALSEKGKELALKAFSLLGEAEADVHGVPKAEVHFHEVGALDSILDTCLSCELFARLNPDDFVCSPLPIGEGQIRCAHGVIPSPAPAVQRLLSGVAVRPLGAEGESITPTGLSLLKAFGAKFGEWPEMEIQSCFTVYGSKVFNDIPNGALFAYGTEQHAH